MLQIHGGQPCGLRLRAWYSCNYRSIKGGKQAPFPGSFLAFGLTAPQNPLRSECRK